MATAKSKDRQDGGRRCVSGKLYSLVFFMAVATFAAQVNSAELLGVLALTDLLGVAFGTVLFKVRGVGSGNSVVSTE